MTIMGEHHCHALGCKATCPPAWLMCTPHWRQVPAKLAARVFSTVRKRDKDVIDATWAPWWRAQAEAIAAVARAEGAREDAVARYLAREHAFANRLENPEHDEVKKHV